MDNLQRCPECGAASTDGRICSDHFHQMLAWEFEHNLPEVHHLMVLCYYLQHPSLYSPEGLDFGRGPLVDFLVDGATPDEVRRRYGSVVDSGARKFTIKGSASSHGAYEHAVKWSMTAADVVRGGVDNYYDNIRAWARLILEDLGASGNLAITRR